MAFGKSDPVLDSLRKQVDSVPNLDMVILNIQRVGSKVHAAFLFENDGIFLLQQLCLFMSSTPAGKTYNGWQEFAVYLGLSREQIQCIEYNFKGMQDPTYYVLLAFCQSSNATIDKIVIACQRISRLDIINRIINPLNQFIDNLEIDGSKAEFEQFIPEIIKPQSLPRVPLVLRPTINISKKLVHSSSNTTNKSTLNEKCNSNLNTKSNYESIVMLTFTKDGEKLAKKAAQLFREKVPKIGVVILQEQEKFVYSRAEEFVDDCFNQVHYIVPILTDGYINHINNLTAYDETEDNSLDTKYVKYIYSLLRYEYFKNNCCNNRVRCFVPIDEMSTVFKSTLHPSLQAWFKETDIDVFANNVLLKKF